MVDLIKEKLPTRTYHKLKYRKIGPCKITKKINDNAYEVSLPDDLNISLVFNIFDLNAFHGEDDGKGSQMEVAWHHHIPHKKEKIAQVLDKKTIYNWQEHYNKYLVQWEGLPPTDSMWIIGWEVQRLDLVKWQQFKDTH